MLLLLAPSASCSFFKVVPLASYCLLLSYSFYWLAHSASCSMLILKTRWFLLLAIISFLHGPSIVWLLLLANSSQLPIHLQAGSFYWLDSHARCSFYCLAPSASCSFFKVVPLASFYLLLAYSFYWLGPSSCSFFKVVPPTSSCSKLAILLLLLFDSFF